MTAFRTREGSKAFAALLRDTGTPYLLGSIFTHGGDVRHASWQATGRYWRNEESPKDLVAIWEE